MAKTVADFQKMTAGAAPAEAARKIAHYMNELERKAFGRLAEPATSTRVLSASEEQAIQMREHVARLRAQERA